MRGMLVWSSSAAPGPSHWPASPGTVGAAADRRLSAGGCAQGAARFRADTQALAAVFAPYTARPAAHLRELCEAAALLNLPPGEAAAAAERVRGAAGSGDGGGGGGGGAVAELRALGVVRLTVEQALCVLAQRLDAP